VADLSDHLCIPRETLHRWRRGGWIHARKLDEPRGWSVLSSEAEELERLRRSRSYPKTWDNNLLKPKVPR
jgi:hypothetical protein